MGYRKKPENWVGMSDYMAANNLGFFLTAPAIFGVVLLVAGIEDGSRSKIGFAIALLAVAPVVALIAWRKRSTR
jgi:undecaprenyl pyrophosphate phosphatase UppP